MNADSCGDIPVGDGEIIINRQEIFHPKGAEIGGREEVIKS